MTARARSRQSFREVCEALQARFRRPVHFQYQSGAEHVAVRSQRAHEAFAERAAQDRSSRDAASVSADVQLMPLGVGAFPLLPLVDDVGGPPTAGLQARARMRLLACVAKAAVNEVSAAEEARALVQSGAPASELLEQADDVGRTALHLAAAQGRALLCRGLAAAPAEVVRAMVGARDLHGLVSPPPPHPFVLIGHAASFTPY